MCNCNVETMLTDEPAIVQLSRGNDDDDLSARVRSRGETRNRGVCVALVGRAAQTSQWRGETRNREFVPLVGRAAQKTSQCRRSHRVDPAAAAHLVGEARRGGRAAGGDERRRAAAVIVGGISVADVRREAVRARGVEAGAAEKGEVAVEDRVDEDARTRVELPELAVHTEIRQHEAVDERAALLEQCQEKEEGRARAREAQHPSHYCFGLLRCS